MHFASRCYVGESVENPRRYFEENVGNALKLLRVMLRHGVDRFVLSSTCATYGVPLRVPIDEEHPQNPVNPYGDSKLFIERILRRYDEAYGLKFVALRYFNASGASPDGTIGESHQPETHLVPLVLQAALGRRGPVAIFGGDYPTRDGTCVRDYIHVLDLADAHVRALDWLCEEKTSDCFNLGTGWGWTVRQVIEAAERISGREVPAAAGPRRAGDPPELVADPGKAMRVLGWRARWSDLDHILETAWHWENHRRY
jgi:UDP-glucose-4-epimerase GalE